MQPQKPKTAIFLSLILFVLLIIVIVSTLIYQSKQRSSLQEQASELPVSTTRSNNFQQIPMTIVKPKTNQQITMPYPVEAKVKYAANTKDLSANLLVDGQENQNLRVRKTPAGDIFLAGTLENLTPGKHSLAIFLYQLGQNEKTVISNANYIIEVVN